VSFILNNNGPLKLQDLNNFMRTNEGVFNSLSNQKTPQAKEFQGKLRELESLRHSLGARSGDGNLPADQVGRVRQLAEQVRASRIEAQKSQMKANTTDPKTKPTTGTENDPYKKFGRYQEGANGQQLRFGNQQLQEGQKGQGVKEFQQQLMRAGFDVGKKGADGFFGPDTAKAAKQFMEKYPDLAGKIDSRAFQRVSALGEGMNSNRRDGRIYNGIDSK
jgi:hypothetical protein